MYRSADPDRIKGRFFTANLAPFFQGTKKAERLKHCNMMKLCVSKRNSCVEMRIDLPSTTDDIRKAAEHLKSVPGDGPVQATNLLGPVHNLWQHIKDINIYDALTINRLNDLAYKIDQMDSQEHLILAGALDVEHAHGMGRILSIIYDLEAYELIPGTASNQELGEWVVQERMLDTDFPGEEQPCLDYSAIGAVYNTIRNGVYTAHGYAAHRKTSPPLKTETPHSIYLTFRTAKGQYPLALPASSEYLERIKQALGLDDFTQSNIDIVRFSPSHLTGHIPLNTITVDGANELALCLRQMEQEDGAIAKYCAALEAEQPDTFSKALSIAKDTDDYELVPENMDEYGKQVLRRIGADDELLDTIDGHMDFSQLGRVSLEEDGVRRTQLGLVRRLSAPFPGQEEIGLSMC